MMLNSARCTCVKTQWSVSFMYTLMIIQMNVKLIPVYVFIYENNLKIMTLI